MAWIKIPAEHHPLFREALPRDGRISVIRMFGALAAMCNGNLFGGLFARSIIVRLSPEHYAEALGLDGTDVFDPMGNGRTMGQTLLLPEDVMEDPAEIKRWLERAFRHTLTLPPKKKKVAAVTPVANAKAPAKKRPSAKKPASAKTKAPAKTKALAKKPAATTKAPAKKKPARGSRLAKRR